METLEGCPRCWPAEAEAAWECRKSLARVNELIDESHFMVALLACPECSQHFISVFVEDVDWVDGDDPQYWSVMPVRMSESTSLVIESPGLMLASLARLSSTRRCLHRDCPKGTPCRISWREGLRLE